MTFEERKALARSYLGKTVRIGIDRPIGYVHKKDIIYPINYGYIPGVLGGDGEEMDVYLLGVGVPVKEFDAHIIAIVHRENDVEDKLVGVPEGSRTHPRRGQRTGLCQRSRKRSSRRPAHPGRRRC